MNAHVADLSSSSQNLAVESDTVHRPVTPRERIRVRFYAAMMLGDVLTPLLSLAGTAALLSVGSVRSQLEFGLTLSMLFLGFASYGRVYTVETLSNWKRGFVRACYAIAIAYVTAVGVAFYAPTFDPPSADIVAIAGVCCLVLIGASRRLVAVAARRVFGPTPISQAVLLDGVPAPARGSSNDVLIDAAEHRFAPRVDDPLMLDRIGRAISPFDRILIACPPERRGDWARALKGSGVQAELLIPEFVDVGPLGAGDYAGTSTVVIANGMLALRERVIKRTLDLAIAVAALIFLMPLLAVVALLVRIDSAGPAMFVQQRLGRGNKLFAMYKFRTMQVGAAGSASGTVGRRDERVTRVGRLLRQTSIDELPQLFNVLLGEMSLVGPRPHVAGATAGEEFYWQVDERYFHRHAAKPGMTGLAQSRGFRGSTQTTSDLVNRLQADLEYMRDWSIWRDLQILLRTFKVIVHVNAY